jgi:hypothetical protein
MNARYPWDEILPRYFQGESVCDLEDEYGFTHRSLYQNLQIRQLKPRGPKQASQHHCWTGGRTKQGKYWYVWVAPDDPMHIMSAKTINRQTNRVAEHRLIMARHLGRPLVSTEEVHHINGNTEDNQIENLQIRHTRHGSGHRKICAECGSENLINIPL